ncbi:MAG: hypothetical protein QM496_14100 [Verrucomicrobiota bacterium]
MACAAFPDYPADEKQKAEQEVVEPGQEEILKMLEEEGIEGEVEVWQRTLTLK